MADINWDEYIFVDCETGGLDVTKHQLLEMSYAVGLNEPITLYPDITDFLDCDPEALRINKLIERLSSEDESGHWYDVPGEFTQYIDAMTDDGIGGAWLYIPVSPEASWNQFLKDAKGKTWVGANPRFDVEFLNAYFNPERLDMSHRLMDLQAYAAGKWGLPKSISFANIIERINDYLDDYGHLEEAILTPDHSALGDVVATREAFAYLVNYKEFSRMRGSD